MARNTIKISTLSFLLAPASILAQNRGENLRITEDNWIERGTPPPDFLNNFHAALAKVHMNNNAQLKKDANANDNDANNQQGVPSLATPHGNQAEVIADGNTLLMKNEGAQNIEDSFAPAKQTDQWTITHKFRQDLANIFGSTSSTRQEDQPVLNGKEMTVLEVGSYLGYTTRTLARLFKKVIAFDRSEAFLQANAQYNHDLNNVFYMQGETVDIDYRMYRANRIDVVFLDAGHDFESVMMDITKVIEHLKPRMIIFDDYGGEVDVKRAVHYAILLGKLEPLAFLGERDFPLRDGRTINEYEGIICGVKLPEHGTAVPQN